MSEMQKGVLYCTSELSIKIVFNFFLYTYASVRVHIREI